MFHSQITGFSGFLEFFIIKFLVWTNKFIDVLVEGAEFKLSDGMSRGRSVALQPNNGFVSFKFLAADMSTC